MVFNYFFFFSVFDQEQREREREGCVGIPSIGGAKQKAILIRAFGVFEY
jgi:hypothetical protein